MKNSAKHEELMLLRIKDEFVLLKNEIKYLSCFLSLSDKFAIFFSWLMLIGVFLPWVSAEGHLTQLGLMGGGNIHVVLTIITFLQARKVIKESIKAQKNKDDRLLLSLRLRRISFYYLLIGACSVILGICILLYFSSQNTVIGELIDVRIGFYLTTFSGIAVFFCGLERFFY
jgi:hypothetical protein